MKKVILTMILSLFLTLSPVAVPLAQASAPTDNLQTFLSDNSSNSTVQGIQQLLALKQKLAQSNKGDILAQVAQQAASAVLPKQGGSAVNQLPALGNVTSVLQNGVRDEITQQLSSKLQPYQTGLQALVKLLGQSQLLPASVVANNSQTGAVLTDSSNITAGQSPVQPTALVGNDLLTSASADSSKAPDNYSKIIDITATAYGPGTVDNGHWGDNDYFGNPLKPGDVAVDPNVIAMGTKLWIPGYGYGVANDQGSAIKGNRVDLFYPDRQVALDYGIQDVKVYVLS